MWKQYFKQAWNLMRQEKLFSAIYIIGTGLAVSMVMALAIALTVSLVNVYPEMDRDRMLFVDYGMIEDGNGQNFANLSAEAIHKCFDGMGDVETMSVIMEWNELGKIQLDGGRQFNSNVRYVDNNFWKVFSFDFVEGRPFTEDDFNARKRVAVVSESLAKSTFGSTDVVGRKITFDFIKYEIAGVVKDVSAITRASYSDIWIPYTCSKYINDKETNDPTGTLGNYSAYMLVKEGADVHAVKREGQQRIDRYSQSLGKGVKFWCMDRPITHFERFFSDRSMFPVDYTNAIILGLIIIILLVIPAVNLSGMTDSRMERRMAELGVRRSFGASKSSLVKQIIIENLLFTFLGGIIGLLISYLLLQGIDDLLFSLLDTHLAKGGRIMLNSDMLFNPWVFVIVLAVCFVLNLCSALIPAWRASRHPITESLRPQMGATMTEGHGMNFFTRIRKNAWIGIELMLVFGLMWFITDFLFVMEFTRSLPAHMDTDHVWNIKIGTLSETNPEYNPEAEDQDRKRADFDLILKAVRQYKDVEECAALPSNGMPFSGNSSGFPLINPQDTSRKIRTNRINVYAETDYFRTFSFTDQEGNPVSMDDFNFDNPDNVVISQRLADYLFPDGDAVGKTIEHDNRYERKIDTYTVAGVVGNAKRTDYERPENNIYMRDDLFFHKYLKNTISVRLKPGTLEQTFADRFMEDMGSKLRIGNFYVKDVESYKTIRDELNHGFGYTTKTSLGRLVAAFFLINIILCVMGAFWYRVRMRREEIGVRMAMGADRKRVMWMLFREGLVLLSIAAAPAILVSLQLVIANVVDYGSLPRGTLHPEYIIDYPAARFLITNLITWLILALTIVVSIWIPAGKAVQLTPADALRDE